MLRFLRIAHLAVIDSAEVDFEPGLNVLTGETGAGKSILVEAVGLLLGGRASGDLVRTGEESAAVEAIFEHGDRELLVRREITAQGRSRAYVDGALATASALKDLSARTIELHGQHEHHTLLDPATHLSTLDAFGNLQAEVEAVRVAFGAMRASGQAVADLRRALSDRSRRLELAQFQLGELDRAGLQPGEDEELAASRQVLASADRIERLCAESYAVLYERDDAILASLGAVWRRIAELAEIAPTFQPYLESRDPIKAQLEDLALSLRRYADAIDASPARLAQVEERLALLERLKRKYGPSLADVIAKRDALRSEVAGLEHGDERLEELTRTHQGDRDAYLEKAGALSAARRRVAGGLSASLIAQLAELAMDQTRFEVRFDADPGEDGWGAHGYDRVEFFLSPNPGEELRPLARIVSGGELSRIMLAIKTLTAASRLGYSERPDRPPSPSAPGLVFDEVDAGIGGRVADSVGRKLRTLGSAFQVLCITHLPQIAAAADTHFLIEKHVEGGRTRTTVRRLDREGRVEEIARMLGGAQVTDRIRASAREMLAGRSRQDGIGEVNAKGESERAKAKPAGTAGAAAKGRSRSTTN